MCECMCVCVCESVSELHETISTSFSITNMSEMSN